MLSAASIAMVANAEPFTYQGQLKDGGQPANGAYDLVFQLMDAPIGGSIVGLSESLEDVDVVDGVFQVFIDFNTAFDGSPRWISVAVRDGASTGFYNTLLPRQLLTAAPEAQHALVADTALNVPWAVAPGVIIYGDGTDRVFINRSSGITISDFFGVHADTSGFVGMFVSGAANSQPFYGYSSDNAINAYSYFDPGSDEWRLWSGGEAMSVDSQQDVHIHEDVFADDFKYNSPKTGVVSVGAQAFHAFVSTNHTSMIGGRGVWFIDPFLALVQAPISLPHGATVTKMTAYCTDEASDYLTISLRAIDHGAIGVVNILAQVTTDSLFGAPIVLTDTSINVPLVNNLEKSYFVQARCPNGPGDFTMSMMSVVVEYTIDEVN
ncbi:hypothetical protein COB72_04845 [bacterium]|nr:MAG: hypothetical protein COB72_04845 [bacterium]